jgi:predicted nucleotidyltransferase
MDGRVPDPPGRTQRAATRYNAAMARTPPPPPPVRRLPSGRIPRAAIRRYVDQVVEKFRPAKVILFGSHAYGKPDADSDVDLLIVMPTKNELSQSIRIRQALWAPFPMDLFVYRPETLQKRLEWEDPFLMEILDKGIVLYEAGDAGLGA